ncbi:MAG: hypothetical protein ACSLFC_11885 [Desulfuromonadales bacterium]
MHALFGANVTGKSTLAYAIICCGMCRPSRGDIVFAGMSILPCFRSARRCGKGESQ